MILTSLAAYYERLLANGAVQPPGFQEKEIAWIVTIDRDGQVVGLSRTGDGKRGGKFKVPAEIKRSVNIAANLLWDNAEYVLGVARAGADGKQAAKVPLRHAAFMQRLTDLPESVKADEGVTAVLRFLERGDRSRLEADEQWVDVIAGGANVSFRLDGDDGLVCERPVIRALDGHAAAGGTSTICLASGDPAVPARLHPSIKGVRGAQSSGASLVSFNLDAFTSHGWVQGANAPVGEHVAQAYGSALNHLLARDNRRRLVEGETTFVFWAARKTVIEDEFARLMGAAEFESDGTLVRQTLRAVRDGVAPALDDPTEFNILGLAPNAARLAVRFWYHGSVKDMARRILGHFDRLAIDGLADDGPPPSLWRLLGAASPGGDPKRLQDQLRGKLAAGLMEAIVKGNPYPATLLARAVDRCRAEQTVTTIRAALVKAMLASQGKEATVSLDPDDLDPGYRLGRLFAVLESIQRTAQKNINTTIRDRYFGAAMTSPRAVFVQLMALKNAHLKKLRRDKQGLGRWFESLIDQILDALPAAGGYPAHLSLDQQGRFILGYHHQRHFRGAGKGALPQDAVLPGHDDQPIESE